MSPPCDTNQTKEVCHEALVTVRNHHCVASGNLPANAQDSSHVSKVGSIYHNYWSSAHSVAVEGDYAYVAAGDSGLHVIDVSTLPRPHEVGDCDTPAYKIAVSGGYAYVIDGGSGLHVIDVSDPTHPGEVGSLELEGMSPQDVEVFGGYAYVAAGDSGLRVIDVSDPPNPAKSDTATHRHVKLQSRRLRLCD